MKNRRFVPRFLAAALVCAMMMSIMAVSASASVVGNTTCVPADKEQTQPDYLTGQVVNRQETNSDTIMLSSALNEPPLSPIATTPPRPMRTSCTGTPLRS